MKAYHVYLIRHGMTQGNKEGKYIGRLDLPVSEQGKEEIAGMIKKYRYPYAEMFFSSPMTRCIETLKLIYPEAEPEIVKDLRECDFGDYEGKALSELKDDPDYQKWASGSIETPPNGESSKSFQLRCCSAFEKIVEKLMRSGTSSAVIVAHGGTIMSILGTYGFPRRQMYEWMTGNAMGYEVVITPQLWISGKAIEVAGAIPLQEDESEFI
ncbi:MAG TPA: phosphoglycerate mutase family protein [Ruminiclostridium sp.]|nr:phosphoglycerate mutase family protein [Ruminiclostridium sp.]